MNQKCEKELNTGTIDSIDCGGDCMEYMALLEDPHCVEVMSWVDGFRAACELLKNSDNRYGIGSMCSQWNTEDVADDLLVRVMEAYHARKAN